MNAEQGGMGRDGDAVRVGCREEETEARGKSSTTGWRLCTALSPVPRDGVDPKVRSFIEWKHATGVRFRCHLLRECHARGAVGEVERPSSQGPPTSPSPSISLNIAGELINRTLPRLGQGYLRCTRTELRARVVEGGGTWCVSKTSKVAGSWELGAVVNHGETRNKSHGGDESPSVAMERTEAPKPQHRPTSWSSSSHRNRCTTFNMAKRKRGECDDLWRCRGG